MTPEDIKHIRSVRRTWPAAGSADEAGYKPGVLWPLEPENDPGQWPGRTWDLSPPITRTGSCNSLNELGSRFSPEPPDKNPAQSPTLTLALGGLDQRHQTCEAAQLHESVRSVVLSHHSRTQAGHLSQVLHVERLSRLVFLVSSDSVFKTSPGVPSALPR